MAKIIVALPEEARPWISHWDLKRTSSLGKFPVYTSAHSSLVVTGVGKLQSQLATSLFLKEYPLRSEEVIVNFGIAGSFSRNHSIGSLFQILKIKDVSSGRAFYPDDLVANPLKPPIASLSTYDSPVLREGVKSPWRHFTTVENTIGEENHLVDMEASGFYSGAVFFVPSFRISLWKVVSDFLDGTFCSRESIAEICEKAIPSVVDWIYHAESLLKREESKNAEHWNDEREEWIQKLAFGLRLTETQTFELMNLAKSYCLRNAGNLSSLEPYLDLEIKEKHQSKKTYAEVRNVLLG